MTHAVPHAARTVQPWPSAERVVACQIGARMHYAVPRTLHSAGMLAHFYTDLRADRGWAAALVRSGARLHSAPVQRLAGRRPHGVPPERSTEFPALGIAYASLWAATRTPSQRTWLALQAGRAFASRVAASGFGDATMVFGYSGECLEVLRAAKEQGLRTVVEQTIAPRLVEERLLQAERRRHPEWEGPGQVDAFAAAYAERERQEWAHADLILCGSDFVRRGIAESGGPVERCIVVPYGVDARSGIGAPPPPPPSMGKEPLRVLTVGAVGLRKGSHHVLAAARLLGERARFRVVGRAFAPAAAIAELRRFTDAPGAVPRIAMAAEFARAEVFLLPSLCEGSATAVYEALAAGLPVVCTPNTGSVVRDGVDGFIVPPGEPDAIVAALLRLSEDPELRAWMAANARARAADHTVNRYGERLLAALLQAPGDLRVWEGAGRQEGVGVACMERDR